MKIRAMFLALAAAGLLGASGYGLYWAGMSHGMKMASPASSGTAPAGGGAGHFHAVGHAGPIQAVTARAQKARDGQCEKD